MKNQIVVCALTGVLALGVVGCGQSSASKTEEKTEQSSSSASSSSEDASSSSASSEDTSSSGSSTDTGSQTEIIDGFEVKYSADDCEQIACKYAGAGGQAKGPALNLTHEGPITGGGTVYYKVYFNLGDVAYEVQVDAVEGKVISGMQTFNGVQQLLDEDGNPIEGTEQEVQE